MTTIDEIMETIEHFGEMAHKAMGEWAEQEDFDEREGVKTDLRALINQAIAEARAEGAREMREAAAQACGETYTMPVSHGDVITEVQRPCYPAGMTAENIRALPLPASTVDVVMDREHGGLTFAPAVTDAKMKGTK